MQVVRLAIAYCRTLFPHHSKKTFPHSSTTMAKVNASARDLYLNMRVAELRLQNTTWAMQPRLNTRFSAIKIHRKLAVSAHFCIFNSRWGPMQVLAQNTMIMILKSNHVVLLFIAFPWLQFEHKLLCPAPLIKLKYEYHLCFRIACWGDPPLHWEQKVSE